MQRMIENVVESPGGSGRWFYTFQGCLHRAPIVGDVPRHIPVYGECRGCDRPEPRTSDKRRKPQQQKRR